MDASERRTVYSPITPHSPQIEHPRSKRITSYFHPNLATQTSLNLALFRWLWTLALPCWQGPAESSVSSPGTFAQGCHGPLYQLHPFYSIHFYVFLFGSLFALYVIYVHLCTIWSSTFKYNRQDICIYIYLYMRIDVPFHHYTIIDLSEGTNYTLSMYI